MDTWAWIDTNSLDGYVGLGRWELWWLLIALVGDSFGGYWKLPDISIYVSMLSCSLFDVSWVIENARVQCSAYI